MLTPFSGLSLIVHLAVIGIGKVLSPLQKRKVIAKSRIVGKKEGVIRAVVNSALSIVIVVVLTALMFTSFGIALQTSIREGAREWQRQQITEAWKNVGDYLQK
ncbi:MAG: hypothetical protein A2836_01065 [Candidatus Taylorbacteria bacterium RIFCSPHIGHO2_01_FULL_45_63]|nr:MAG: hypothetical protein A2836_01065 [Candidatus Taylorbacteria bacterium RIFCSPHIGHO2_01_FULL_45_63]OHA35022.1 MAG: hypothetical protein A3A22_02325 [Candidatus Taylorbacteria bacterium RIFCSPLOWO2_01_FULL_45_34b]